MNELLFFFHIILTIFIVFAALKIGKEALISLTALLAVAANFFVLKQIILFKWNITCSDVFAVGTILSLNLLQEHFGKEAARRGVVISFFAMVFFSLMSQIHLFYIPSPYDYAHPSYFTLLSPTPRLFFASLLSFFLVQQFDIAFFGFLKNRLATWWVRNTLSLFVSQLLDTVLFSFLGLYGVVESVQPIIVVSLLAKLTIIITVSFFSPLSRRTSYEV